MANQIEPPEVIEVERAQVACDGGDDAMGHPRVYLNMGDKGFVECPYCDRRFVLKEGADASAGH
ncbi:zinc-finger domain-containing protein [Limibacillus halophilus]|uniref:Putative Zn-finger protein n=1 Tax=Limibacillus halophilus TaxID=1579333 RepID=A0A839SXL7_9PROT|nr:zinc-finger domain-containing protein [Limibacillus halophilus]MBB3066420.1 putative Zn-finger protein [Limibacillus halophilus]